MSEGPRVVIVDDHALFRSGVRAELSGRVEVVGDAGSVAQAVELVRTTEPDVVLLDVHMPDGGGVEVIGCVVGEHPAVRFLALSVSDAAEDVITVIRAGARGYVTKRSSGADLVDAVRRVAAGDAVFSPRLAGFVLDAFAALPPADQAAPSFDPSRRSFRHAADTCVRKTDARSSRKEHLDDGRRRAHRLLPRRRRNR